MRPARANQLTDQPTWLPSQSSIQPPLAFPCHVARAPSRLTEHPMLPNTLRSRGPSYTSHTIHDDVCTWFYAFSMHALHMLRTTRTTPNSGDVDEQLQWRGRGLQLCVVCSFCGSFFILYSALLIVYFSGFSVYHCS